MAIPARELESRRHELPAKSQPIRVIDGRTGSRAAFDWLRQRGHPVELVAPPACVDHRGGGYRLWEPHPAVEHLAGRLPPGTVLDLGCGSGRNAAYLACCGHPVLAIDRLPDALTMAADLCARYAPGRFLEFLQGDLDRHPIPVRGSAGAIFACYYHPLVLAKTIDAVRVGGAILIGTFSAEHRAKTGHPARAERCPRPEDWSHLAVDLEIDDRIPTEDAEMTAILLRVRPDRGDGTPRWRPKHEHSGSAPCLPWG